MENRVGSSHGAQNPQRSRSMDLKSLYKSKVSEESSKMARSKGVKRKGCPEYSGSVENNKKKIKKESLAHSPKIADRNSQKSLADIYNGDIGSRLKDTSLTERENGGVSLSLSSDGLRIPKRKRGFIGRKKVEAPFSAEPLSQSACFQGLSDQTAKLEHVLSGDGIIAVRDTHVDTCYDEKEEKDCSLNLNQRHDGETDVAAKSNDLSLKKPRKNRRKKKIVEATEKFVQVAEPLINDPVSTCGELPEEDEENLEENAAMMLSLRFDPSCTGFGSNSKAFKQSKSKLSFSSRGQNAASCHDGSDPALLDATNWKLRPRKQHKEKGLLRKRRHFYDIAAAELDPLWVLDKKIKVFWPLDDKWYFGLVNDYDEERKRHHIKYEDREEEWVDLKNEKIKLLLLRGEVPGIAEQKSAVSDDKQLYKRKLNMKSPKEAKKGGRRGHGNNVDSEPIISWLARSKTSTSQCVKKQTISVSAHSSPSFSNCDKVSFRGSVGDGSLKRKKRKSRKESATTDGSGRSTDRSLKSAVSLKDSKLPIVYVRRYSRRSKKPFLGKEEGQVLAPSSSCGVSSSSISKRPDLTGDLDISFGKFKTCRSTLPIVDSGLQYLMDMLFKPGECRFELCIPIDSFRSQPFVSQNQWLFHALPRRGALMVLWPDVQLEMLFVDTVVGLRFLLFEGSLKEAVEFIFRVLALFAATPDDESYASPQVPSTSISFKFVSVQGRRRQLNFTIFNFFKLRASKWMYLDLKLTSHCLLTKRLPLSECTYDNIRLLQNGTCRLPVSSQCSLSLKGLQKKYRPGMCKRSVQKVISSYMNVDHSCNPNSYRRTLPPFALSFAAAPTFFLSLHLQLLMKHTVLKASALTVHEHDAVEHPENDCFCRYIEFQTEGTAFPDCSISSMCLSSDEAGIEKTNSPNDQSGTDVLVSGVSGASPSLDLGTDEYLQKNHSDMERSTGSSAICHISQRIPSSSLMNGISVEIPQVNHVDKSVKSESQSLAQPSDMPLHGNGSIVPSPNPTAPRTVWNRTRSSSFGNSSHGWADMKVDSLHNGFVSGPKKPRTQVSYLLPLGGFDMGSKHRSPHQKNVPHKRIRRSNEKRVTDTVQKNFDVISCGGNVLVTRGDRGWRECGAQIVLELAEQNEWKLAVKISGTTQFSYKAHQFFQVGSTNRYTHAMMWKGGKEWTLEFPDRGQWTIFKEMHEECYNRNIRAASIKSIPIPGVRLVDENDECWAEGMFVRSSSKYARQVETDVEMALNPSRVLYDMDSDDEEWMSKNQSSSGTEGSDFRQLSDEVFERTMDLLEKAAYVQQRDQFTSDEIEELVNDANMASLELVKTIYEHWRQKRQRKGMALVRHLQPPSWERYQQQVREWEQSTNKANSALPNGCKKAPETEKPPMFAFCMKPRGLEVPYKGSKQRSHKKMSVSMHNYTAYGGEHDGSHYFGRRSGGYTFGDERVMHPGHNYEYLEDNSPLYRSSPRDASNHRYVSMNGDGYHYSAFHRSKSKKFGSLISPKDRKSVASYGPGASTGWGNGVSRRNDQLKSFRGPTDGSDMDEFIIRDASSAAQHARNIAKMKRERARKMFNRADLLIHKAVSAMMTADAMKLL